MLRLWHCPNSEHVLFAMNSHGNAKTNGASNNSHTLCRRNEATLIANAASHSHAIQMQIDTIPAVGAV